MKRKRLLCLACLVVLLPFLKLATADEPQGIPVTAKAKKIQESGSLVAKEHPVTVMANDLFVLERIKEAKKENQKAKFKSATNAIKLGGEKSIIEAIHLSVPFVGYKIINEGPNFIFEDITQREENISPVSRSLLSKEMRFQQVDALRQSAAAKKQY